MLIFRMDLAQLYPLYRNQVLWQKRGFHLCASPSLGRCPATGQTRTRGRLARVPTGSPAGASPLGLAASGPGCRSSPSGGRSLRAVIAPAPAARLLPRFTPTQTGPLQCPSASVPRRRILPPDFARAVPKPLVKEAASAGPRRAAQTLRLAPGRSDPRPRRRWRAERRGAASEGRALPGRGPGV